MEIVHVVSGAFNFELNQSETPKLTRLVPIAPASADLTEALEAKQAEQHRPPKQQPLSSFRTLMPTAASSFTSLAAAGDGERGVLPLPLPPSLQIHYPSYFMKRSTIELNSGKVNRIEELRTEHFVQSAKVSSDLRMYSLKVIKIEEFPDRGEVNWDFSKTFSMNLSTVRCYF